MGKIIGTAEEADQLNQSILRELSDLTIETRELQRWVNKQAFMFKDEEYETLAELVRVVTQEVSESMEAARMLTALISRYGQVLARESFSAERHVSHDGKEYRDDKGKIYRRGDKLEANSTYQLNGYIYTTDGRGRITSAGGILCLNNDKRGAMKDKLCTIGRGDELDGDVRGHIIAAVFGGDNSMGNLLAQDGVLNDGEYKKMEMELKAALNDNAEVEYEVRPIYTQESMRPTAYAVSYLINGTKSNWVFLN